MIQNEISWENSEYSSKHVQKISDSPYESHHHRLDNFYKLNTNYAQCSQERSETRETNSCVMRPFDLVLMTKCSGYFLNNTSIPYHGFPLASGLEKSSEVRYFLTRLWCQIPPNCSISCTNKSLEDGVMWLKECMVQAVFRKYDDENHKPSPLMTQWETKKGSNDAMRINADRFTTYDVYRKYSQP